MWSFLGGIWLSVDFWWVLLCGRGVRFVWLVWWFWGGRWDCWFLNWCCSCVGFLLVCCFLGSFVVFWLVFWWFCSFFCGVMWWLWRCCEIVLCCWLFEWVLMMFWLFLDCWEFRVWCCELCRCCLCGCVWCCWRWFSCFCGKVVRVVWRVL